MIKFLILLILFCPSLAFAEISGYLFLSRYYSHEQQDLEGREVNYKAGVYLEKKTKWPTFFLKEETLIFDIDDGKSYPRQINYMIGIKQKIKSFELILQHECLHPVDGASNGRKAESYNLIEGRYNF